MASVKACGWVLGAIVASSTALPATGCAAVTSADDYKTNDCAKTSDCAGDNVICRKTDGKCVGLLSNECKEVFGDPKNDDAVIFGATVSLTGSNASVGIAEKNALQLALDDFRISANGLPPLPGSTKRRPLAIVVCDDAAAVDVATLSAKHLTNDLHVPAILGESWSGVAVSLLTNVTVPAQTLMIATGVTSPDLSNLPKDNLFFRTITSMVGETQAMSSLVLDTEKLVKAASTSSTALKVALVHKGDSFGKGSAQVMQKNLVFNGLPALDPGNAANFQTLDYGDSGNPAANPLKYPETVAKVLAQKPPVIVAIGSGELYANIVQPVESGWDANSPRPYWILSHTAYSSAITSYLVGNDPTGSLRKRILGTTPGTEDTDYQQFKANYTTQVRDGTNANSFGTSNTYDAMYLATYLVASLGSTPITGRSMSNAMGKILSGPAIEVGSNDLNHALTLLSEGTSINLNGVSGPLDFDLATGDVLQPIQVWCVPADGAGKAQSPKTSGYAFGLDGKTPTGTIDLVKNNCSW